MRGTLHSESLTGLFARAEDALLASLEAQLKSSDFSICDWRVLRALLAEDGVRISDLAERALSHQVTITQAIGRMEWAGLVRRRIPSDDRRSRCVYLTAHGRGVAEQLAAVERRHDQAASRALGGAASQKLKNVLLRLLDAIEGSSHSRHQLGSVSVRRRR